MEIKLFIQSQSSLTITDTEKKFIENNVTLSELIEQTFKRFFQSYALSFNKMHNRKGNLFYKPFKRISIAGKSQFIMAMIYIHGNSVKHGLVKDFSVYKWSSWKSILSNKPTLLAREDIISWFGSLDACIKAHFEMTQYFFDCEVGLEY